MSKYIISLLAGGSLLATLFFTGMSYYNTNFVSSNDGGLQINFEKLEIADDSFEQRQGMMYRREVCEECGMLFVFENEARRTFWMKNTLVPLDIIFIKGDGLIDNVAQNAKTNQTQERYSSNGNVKYVLEVNAGWSSKKNLANGQKIDMNYLLNQGVDYETNWRRIFY